MSSPDPCVKAKYSCEKKKCSKEKTYCRKSCCVPRPCPPPCPLIQTVTPTSVVSGDEDDFTVTLTGLNLQNVDTVSVIINGTVVPVPVFTTTPSRILTNPFTQFDTCVDPFEVLKQQRSSCCGCPNTCLPFTLQNNGSYYGQSTISTLTFPFPVDIPVVTVAGNIVVVVSSANPCCVTPSSINISITPPPV